MNNVEFSKEGRALLKNRTLASYTVRKMANLTKEEIEDGKTIIPLSDGHKLVLKFGAPKVLKKEVSAQPV